MKVLKVLAALIKPIGSLIRDLEDGKISEDEKDELIAEFGLAVAVIVSDIIKK